MVPNLCLRRLTLNLKAVNTSYVLTLTEEVYLFRDTSMYFDSTLENSGYFSYSKYKQEITYAMHFSQHIVLVQFLLPLETPPRVGLILVSRIRQL